MSPAGEAVHPQPRTLGATCWAVPPFVSGLLPAIRSRWPGERQQGRRGFHGPQEGEGGCLHPPGRRRKPSSHLLSATCLLASRLGFNAAAHAIHTACPQRRRPCEHCHFADGEAAAREVTGRPQGRGRLQVSGRGRRSAVAGPVPQALGCCPWPPDASRSVEQVPRGVHHQSGALAPGNHGAMGKRAATSLVLMVVCICFQ